MEETFYMEYTKASLPVVEGSPYPDELSAPQYATAKEAPATRPSSGIREGT
jgi:hypothetical protein